MATDLLSDGIRRFAADTEKLEKILMEKLWCVCFIRRLLGVITWLSITGLTVNHHLIHR